MRPLAAFVAAALLLALAPPGAAANFGVHAGLGYHAWGDQYFRAGALLADLDHFLPPGEPRTDDLAFTQGIIDRARPLSRNAWRFATGWYEHLDQDARFADSRDRTLAAHPSYTDTDVRLAFDFLTLQRHPFPTSFDFLLANNEILRLIQGGLVSTDLAGVRDAVFRLLHSTDMNAPGLDLQLQAAQLYGQVYPSRVTDMAAEYDSYFRLVTASYVPVFPRLDTMLMSMALAILPHRSEVLLLSSVMTAIRLEATRPGGWTAQEVQVLRSFLDALPGSSLPLAVRYALAHRATWIVNYLD